MLCSVSYKVNTVKPSSLQVKKQNTASPHKPSLLHLLPPSLSCPDYDHHFLALCGLCIHMQVFVLLLDLYVTYTFCIELFCSFDVFRFIHVVRSYNLFIFIAGYIIPLCKYAMIYISILLVNILCLFQFGGVLL